MPSTTTRIAKNTIMLVNLYTVRVVLNTLETDDILSVFIPMPPNMAHERWAKQLCNGAYALNA
jgi:hypothetical protein